MPNRLDETLLETPLQGNTDQFSPPHALAWVLVLLLLISLLIAQRAMRWATKHRTMPPLIYTALATVYGIFVVIVLFVIWMLLNGG